MTDKPRFTAPFRKALPVLVALLLVLLGARVAVDKYMSQCARNARAARTHAVVASTAPAHAPAAVVPKPNPLHLRDVPAPARWSYMASLDAIPRLDFTIDLDYFAPLGDGPANAALWFRDFARDDGSRAATARDASRVPVELFGRQQKVFPPDDPLLREAEPWVDQATCRFYPDIWKPTGLDMPIANLLFAIDLAKS